MLSEHRLRRRVHFYEVDMAGFVHFSWFFRYMEEAEHALWRAAGLTIARPGEELGFPRLAASCQFHAPLRFEDEFEVWLRIADITSRTIRYSCLITRGDVRIATGALTIVCIRLVNGRPGRAVEIPADILERLQVAPATDAAAR